MSTTHHQVAGKCNSSEAGQLTGFCGFGSWSGEVIVKECTGLWRELDMDFKTVLKKLWRSEHFWKMRSAKCAPHCSKSSISPSKLLKKMWRSEHFWKMRSAKCTRLYREVDFKKKSLKTTMFGVARNRSHCRAARMLVDLVDVTLLLCVFATGCDKTHWRGCVQQSELTRSFSLIHWFTNSLSHWFTESLILWIIDWSTH